MEPIKPIEIEGLHLTRDEQGRIVVEVQVEGLWYPVIKEGHENPDHWLNSRGIEHEIFRINMELTKDSPKDEPVEEEIDICPDCGESAHFGPC